MEIIYNGESRFTIPTNATEIKEENFYFSELKELTVPGNIRKIGARAFAFSVKMKKAVIEEGVEEIGESAFENCDSLETVVLPESIKTIHPNAFFSCEKLKKINIPKSLTCLPDGMFFGCEGLEKIEIPENVKELGENLFYDCESLKSVNMPYVAKIPVGLFVNCRSLEKAVIPESVTDLEISAFAGCSRLKKINIPKNAKLTTSVKAGAKKVEICSNLTDINVHPENPYYSSCDGVVYSKDGSVLLGMPMSREGEFTVPEKVKEIGPCAFFNAYKLTKIIIGKNVRKIGVRAFAENDSLKEIEVSPKNSSFASRDGVLFTKDMTQILAYPNQKADEIYVIPDEVKILENQFEGSENLKKLVLGKHVETIFGYFEKCRSLEEFEVCPENQKFASDEGVLLNKEKNKIIQYPQGRKDECFALKSNIIGISEKAFFGTKYLKDVKLAKSSFTRFLKLGNL